MARKIRTWCRLVTVKVASSFRRFPEAAAFLGVTVALLIYMLYREEASDLLDKIAWSLSLGFPLSLSLRLLLECYAPHRPKVRFMLFPLTFGLLIIYFFLGFKGSNPVTTTRYVAYRVTSYLAFLFLPYLSRRQDFELYVLDLAHKFCVSFLYAAALYLGIVLTLLTINQLFAITIKAQLYFTFWLICAGLFAPLYFLAELPGLDHSYTQTTYPPFLKILFLYILIPIVTVYTLILYAYFGKIIFTRTWPVGLVAHLVLWFALLSSLLLFLLYPLRRQNQALNRFSQVFPWFLLPLIGMMFVAMGKRIAAFGLTENRYYVLLAGLWVGGWLLYYGLAKHPRNVLLPVSLAIVAFLSVTGPWSSFAIAKYSQNRRLVKLLRQYGMLEGTAIISRADLPLEGRREISAVLAYFDDNHSLKEIGLLPAGFKLNEMEKIFGFKFERGGSNLSKDYFHWQLADQERILSLGGDTVFVDLNQVFEREIRIQHELYTLAYFREDYLLVITRGGKEIYRKNVKDLLTKELEKEQWDLEPSPSLRITDRQGDLELQYLFKEMWGYRDPVTERLEVTGCGFYLFLHQAFAKKNTFPVDRERR